MKKPFLTTSLLLLVSLGVGSTSSAADYADCITLSWQAPSKRENGNALSLSELAGYEIYATSSQGFAQTYKVAGGENTSYQICSLPQTTTVFLAMAALDNESTKSRLSPLIGVYIRTPVENNCKSQLALTKLGLGICLKDKAALQLKLDQK